MRWMGWYSPLGVAERVVGWHSNGIITFSMERHQWLRQCSSLGSDPGLKAPDAHQVDSASSWSLHGLSFGHLAAAPGTQTGF